MGKNTQQASKRKKGTLKGKLSIKSVSRKDKHSAEALNVRYVLYNSFFTNTEVGILINREIRSPDFTEGEDGIDI